MTEPKRLRDNVDSEPTNEKTDHPHRKGKRIRPVAVAHGAPEAVTAASRPGSGIGDHMRTEGGEATGPTGVGDVPQPRGRGGGPGSGPMTEPKRLRESADA